MADIPANDGGWSGGWAFETGNRSPGNAKSTELGGDDQPHENRPPYYALAYIMKL